VLWYLVAPYLGSLGCVHRQRYFGPVCCPTGNTECHRIKRCESSCSPCSITGTTKETSVPCPVPLLEAVRIYCTINSQQAHAFASRVTRVPAPAPEPRDNWWATSDVVILDSGHGGWRRMDPVDFWLGPAATPGPPANRRGASSVRPAFARLSCCGSARVAQLVVVSVPFYLAHVVPQFQNMLRGACTVLL
jgi:hypothetical protein